MKSPTRRPAIVKCGGTRRHKSGLSYPPEQMWTGAPAIFRIHYESGTLIVRSSRAVASAAGRHALIIEDEILIALEVEALLEDLGFDSFDIAESPDEALACAAAHR